MADTDPVLFDRRSATLIERVVRRELARQLNRGGDPLAKVQGVYGRWIPFINDSSEEAPANAIMSVVSGMEYDTDLRFSILHCTKPSTTFYRQLAVNSGVAVAAGDGGGLCTLWGDVDVVYDSGTPAHDEGWGVKPGQWTLSKGFPGVSVFGITDSTNKILHGIISPITTLLGKTTGTWTAGTPSTSYQIWCGNDGGESNGGWTTVPSAISRVDIDNDILIELTWRNNGWEVKPLECNS